jgi:ribosomal protein S27AE
MDEDEWEDDKFLSPKEQWEKEHDTGTSAGTCPNCGSKIFQSTYTDSCMCGEQDFAY